MRPISIIFFLPVLIFFLSGSTAAVEETTPVASGTTLTGVFKLISVSRDSSVAEIDTDFATVVHSGTVPVLIHFSAVWAAPCKAMHPVLIETAKRFGKRALIGTVDIEESPEIGQMYSVYSVPTFLVLVNGRETSRHVGMMSLKKLTGLVEN